MSHAKAKIKTDIALIGAGIMSSTLATMIKELDPDLSIHQFETLGKEAQESSEALNNAGTGHAANCELNYTPMQNGKIQIDKALEVNHEFDLSRQLWSYLVKKGAIEDPQKFIHCVPHYSFVRGEENVAYLNKRYQALKEHYAFQDMIYVDEPQKINEMLPLVMQGRDPKEKVAITQVNTGTDVNYGNLTSLLIQSLKQHENYHIHFNHHVHDLTQIGKKWLLSIHNTQTREDLEVEAKFVFVGAGGGALHLLQKSGIPESTDYAGFPVSGVWLCCDNPEVTQQHNAKVYGLASVGSPPMSVPHLDRRHIDGKVSLLFGPYAGFTTKFLKHGSYTDYFRSLDMHNLLPTMTVGLHSYQLEKYLVGQVLESKEERIECLKEYYPDVHADDWHQKTAGIRVQIIKKHSTLKGQLQFGTEIVKSQDGSLAALLGASPGASTAVYIMVHVLEQCFKDQLKNKNWQDKLKEMIPSHGNDITTDQALWTKIREYTASTLKIKPKK